MLDKKCNYRTAARPTLCSNVHCASICTLRSFRITQKTHTVDMRRNETPKREVIEFPRLSSADYIDLQLHRTIIFISQQFSATQAEDGLPSVGTWVSTCENNRYRDDTMRATTAAALLLNASFSYALELYSNCCALDCIFFLFRPVRVVCSMISLMCFYISTGKSFCVKSTHNPYTHSTQHAHLSCCDVWFFIHFGLTTDDRQFDSAATADAAVALTAASLSSNRELKQFWIGFYSCGVTADPPLPLPF